jgi:hypothetical protein
MGQQGSKLAVAALSAVVFLSSLALLRALPHDDSYHVDEGFWIGAGHYAFQTAFVQRDFSYLAWSDPRFHTFGTRNPPLGKYIVGAGIHLGGRGDVEHTFPGFDFRKPWVFSDVAHRRPEPEVLRLARTPMPWLGAGSATLLFLLVCRLTASWLLGLLSAIIFFSQPLVLSSTSRAIMDIPALFFSLLLLWSAASLGPSALQPGRGPVFRYALAVGIGCGLALSTKLSTLTAAATAGIWMLIEVGAIVVTRQRSGQLPWSEALRNCRTSLLHTVAAGVGSVTVAALVFYALNPYLYTHPIQNTERIWQLTEIVSNYRMPPEVTLDTWHKRWSALWRFGFEDSGWLSHWFGLKWADGALAGCGLIMLGARAFGRSSLRRRLNALHLLVWMLLLVGTIVSWAPFAWRRWYVPLEPVWAVLEVLGAVLLSELAHRRWRLWRAAR